MPAILILSSSVASPVSIARLRRDIEASNIAVLVPRLLVVFTVHIAKKVVCTAVLKSDNQPLILQRDRLVRLGRGMVRVEPSLRRRQISDMTEDETGP
jgi:hypothetical protein